MNNSLISVIIPVWCGRPYLTECLNTLLSQEGVNFEVILVDNASPDDSANWLAENYPQLQLIRNQSNLGFAGACNVGINVARGDVLLLLNQDTRMKPGCLRALARVFANPRIGIAGCKILYPDGKTIQHAGGRIDWPHGFTHHYGQGEPDTGAWDVPRPVEYVTGAALAFHRDLISRVGTLDEGFWPGYFEDTDFCLRAREAGYEVWYVPDAVLFHNESSSIADTATVFRFGHRGRLRFILKHLHPEHFLEQFVPAEESHQGDAIRVGQGRALRIAYLETMCRADLILRDRWQSERDMIYRVISALQYLYQRAWDTERTLTSSREVAKPSLTSRQVWLPPQDLYRPSISSVQETAFQSRLPLVGWLRSILYKFVVQPVMDHITRQQQTINEQYFSYLCEIAEETRVLAYSLRALESRLAELTNESETQVSSLQAIERHLHEMADADAVLAGEIARLTVGLADELPMPYYDYDLKRATAQRNPA